MKNEFTAAQLAEPGMALAAKAVRTCVHCGICTASCPTYIVTGDERDGPRGRIQFMQRMLEAGGAPSPQAVRHIDRCLSCLNCRSACPSSVDYARLVDKARGYIEDHYSRPPFEKLLRWFIAAVLTRPALIRLMLPFAPLGRLLPGRLGAMASKAQLPGYGRVRPAPLAKPAQARKRIALLPGCVQKALAPQIDAAAARLLARRGIELVELPGAGCCGALSHHLGREAEARAFALRLINAYEAGGYDGVFISATGCGAYLKELEFLFDGDAGTQARARAFAAAFVDLLELLEPQRVTPPAALRVAYHPACSLQNTLKLGGRGEAALKAAGFILTPFAETNICCGSAGSYAILQPELSGILGARKLSAIQAANPDVIVSGNIGCIQQLAGSLPVLHIAELLDWAEGGPQPDALVLPHPPG